MAETTESPVAETPAAIEIKSRWDRRMLWSGPAPDVRTAVLLAIASKADLQNAYLQGAYLQGAYLQNAYLRGADLRYADLRGADLQNAYLQNAYLQNAYLQNAYLQNAYLQNAYLQGADLRYADLRYADLQGADLQGADLQGADLRYADLRGADLRGADLQGVREDLFDVLGCASAEVPGLLAALRGGRVNGSAYTGVCACLVGTLANVRGCSYTGIPGLIPNSERPAERWFLAIGQGHTPENNPIAKITAEWIEEWMAANAIAGTEANATAVAE